MKPARIAERSGTIRASSPFRSIDPIAAVTSSRRGGALDIRPWLARNWGVPKYAQLAGWWTDSYPAPLFHFRSSKGGRFTHSVIHLGIVIFHGGFALAFPGRLTPITLLYQVPYVLQRPADIVQVTEHLRHLPLCGKSLGDRPRSVLFLRNFPISFGEVKNRS